jgi:hypothetical protein
MPSYRTKPDTSVYSGPHAGRPLFRLREGVIVSGHALDRPHAGWVQIKIYNHKDNTERVGYIHRNNLILEGENK